MLVFLRHSTVRCIIVLHARSSSSSSSLSITGRSGLVVARLPAAREGPGSNRAADKRLCFHENHCDTQLSARAAH